MRILFDLQDLQVSEYKNIKKYIINFTKKIIENLRSHEFLILINSSFSGSLRRIKKDFFGLVPEENIFIWHKQSRKESLEDNALKYKNFWLKNRNIEELSREAFIANLKPDIVHLYSFFDSSINSIGLLTNIPTSIMCFDLNSLIHSIEAQNNSSKKKLYFRKIHTLQKANMIFSFSKDVINKAIKHLGILPENIININPVISKDFQKLSSSKLMEKIKNKYGIDKAFIFFNSVKYSKKDVINVVSAFNKLSDNLKDKVQLLVAGNIPSTFKKNILSLVNEYTNKNIFFINNITDKELAILYNSCSLCIVSFTDADINLPILEAIACEAPVLCSANILNSEMINNITVVYDQNSPKDLANKIEKILTNKNFRNELIQSIKKQLLTAHATESALKLVIQEFERLYQQKQAIKVIEQSFIKRKKLAYISPLPPVISGISDYSASLIPALAKYYDIDLIVSQAETLDDCFSNICQVFDSSYFMANHNIYDRIIYHMGNSIYHEYAVNLIQKIPGIIVLHDFFLSSMKCDFHYRKNKEDFLLDLYHSHGYLALIEDSRQEKIKTIYHYPINFSIVQHAVGVLVHSDFSRELAKTWYNEKIANEWIKVPFVRTKTFQRTKLAAKTALNLAPDEFIICSFGFMHQIKLNYELIVAFLNFFLLERNKAKLIFVGLGEGIYFEKMKLFVENTHLKNKVQFTGRATAKEYELYLQAADMAVQLRNLSRGETSAALYDCLNCGIPTIINAHGSFKEISTDLVYFLPDRFTISELTNAIEYLWNNQKLREKLTDASTQYIEHNSSPNNCAKKYFEAIEYVYQNKLFTKDDLLKKQKEIFFQDVKKSPNLLKNIQINFPGRQSKKQLFLDITALKDNLLDDEIKPVVLKILNNLILQPVSEYRIEPIYYNSVLDNYCYARNFTAKIFGIDQKIFNEEEAITIIGQDAFLGLDGVSEHIVLNRRLLLLMQNRGLKIYFMVYNMSPIFYPKYFSSSYYTLFKKWLCIISKFTLICTSNTVENELKYWAANEKFIVHNLLEVFCFTLEVDVSKYLKFINNNEVPVDSSSGIKIPF